MMKYIIYLLVINFSFSTQVDDTTNRIVSVFAYRGSFALTSNKDVYCFGSGSQGRLGLNDTNHRHFPTLIEKHMFSPLLNSTEDVISVSAGDVHSIFLTSHGNVYSAGYGESGRTGLGVNGILTYIPTRIERQLFSPPLAENETIVSAVAGRLHSVFVTSNGNAYSCGSGMYGINGHGDGAFRLVPSRIEANLFNPPLSVNERVILTAVGDLHSLLLTSHNHIYGFGLNDGQLGLGVGYSQEGVPKRIDPNSFSPPVDDDILLVSTGNFHSLVVTASGNIYTFGQDHLDINNQTQRLVPTLLPPTLFSPQLEIGERVVSTSIGVSHSLYLTTFGKVYSAGLGDKGQLGLAGTTVANAPTHITTFNPQLLDDETITAVACTVSEFSLLLTSAGNIYSFGSYSFGQLGLGTTHNIFVPTLIEPNTYNPPLLPPIITTSDIAETATTVITEGIPTTGAATTNAPDLTTGGTTDSSLPTDEGSSTITTEVTTGTIDATTGAATTTGATTATTNITETTEDKLEESDSRVRLEVMMTTLVTVGLLILVIAAFLIYRKKRILKPNDGLEMNETKNLKDIEILERLGGGAFSDVYRGLWNNASVALKKLKSEQDIDEFSKEASILKSLSFTYIIQYFGIYQSPTGERYIVTEFLSQGSLSNFLTKHMTEVTYKDLVGMARDASSGLEYLHKNGLVHGDLALRNLLITNVTDENGARFIVKVGDFGMSKVLQNKQYYRSESKMIPFKWASPETIEYGIFSLVSDVWSFGVVLWELFSYGKLPYPTLTNSEVLDKLKAGYRLPCPEDCSENIYALMMRCWSWKQESRPATKEISEFFYTIWHSLNRSKNVISASDATDEEAYNNLYLQSNNHFS